jgi:sucrose-6-phosphate hydrolase SacC (GH32 family)
MGWTLILCSPARVVEICTPLVVTEESYLHQAKFISPKTATDEGRIISTKPVLKNANFSIRDNFDPDSIITDESNLHSQQHISHKTSTDAGIIISTKPVRLNASFSIRDNLDPDSNITEESNPHQ